MNPGDRVGGRYRIERAIASGGMGSVFRAVDEHDGSSCAVKVVHDDALGSPRAIRRFEREVLALREVDHPGVVRYLDHGTFGVAHMPFLVMEWVEGPDLRARLRKGPPPSFGESLRVLVRLVQTLAAVHAVGIVHRDIKPRNLVLPGGKLDQVRVVDFGLACFPQRRGLFPVELTVNGFRLGSPGYMAPEQVRHAKDVDAAADVFSLGCIAFELLTGQRAFPGRDDIARLAQLLVDEPPRAGVLNPNLPAALDALVSSMLSRDPAARPRLDAQLLAQLTAFSAVRRKRTELPVPPVVRRQVAVDDAEPATVRFAPRLLARVFEDAPTHTSGPIPVQLAPLGDVVRRSWDALDGPTRSALVRLATFEGPFSTAEAEAVIAYRGKAASTLLAVGESLEPFLQQLQERSLVVRSPSGMQVPPVVRAFVREQQPDVEPAAWICHAEVVVDACMVQADRVHAYGSVAASEYLTRRQEDLLLVAEGDGAHAARAILALDASLLGRAGATAHYDRLTRGIVLAETHAESDLFARLRCARGRAGVLLGRTQEAIADLSAALAHARRIEDANDEASALIELVVLYHRAGQVETGERCANEVLALRGRFDSPRLEARAVGNLGGLAHDRGELDVAYARYVEAIALAEAAADQKLLGVYLTNLAMLDADRDNTEAACQRLRRAVRTLELVHESRLAAIALGNLGMVQTELGLLDEAIESLQRAAEVLEQVGDDRSAALARMRLTAPLSLAGKVQNARDALRRSRAPLAGDARSRAIVEVFEAFLHLSQGDRALARRCRDLAYVPLSSDRILAAISDDTRAALRILAPRLR